MDLGRDGAGAASFDDDDADDDVDAREEASEPVDGRRGFSSPSLDSASDSSVEAKS